MQIPYVMRRTIMIHKKCFSGFWLGNLVKFNHAWRTKSEFLNTLETPCELFLSLKEGHIILQDTCS